MKERGIPKKDGSGQGMRKNKNREGCRQGQNVGRQRRKQKDNTRK